MSNDPLLDFQGISPEDERRLRAQCLEGLRSDESRRIFDAAQSVRWFRGDDELLEALLELLEAPEPARRALALDGLANLEHPAAAGPLTGHVRAVHRTPEESAHAVYVLGRVGDAGVVPFLERLAWDPTTYDMEIRSRAIEALLSLAQRGHEAAATLLETANASEELAEELKELAAAALRELATGDWDHRGFATLEAELPPPEDPDPS
jgi:HEAT repeat protein